MNLERRPNLFIIGAMKSGTSSLHAYLGTHPSVFMCEPKEPGYFVEQLNLKRGRGWYSKLFHGAEGASIRGESSTEYTKAPMYGGVPQRLAEFNPQAKIIYLMRDPIERSISHYWHMVRWHGEHRSLETAIRCEPQYRQVSYYAMQLRPYLELFGRERVLTRTFEEFTADTLGTVRSVFKWLGVDDQFVPPNLESCENSTPAVVERVRGLGWLHRFRHSRLWNSAGGMVPRRIRRLGVRLATSPVRRKDEFTDSVSDYLRERQVDEVRELSQLLAREFPEWRTVRGDRLEQAKSNLRDGRSELHHAP